ANPSHARSSMSPTITPKSTRTPRPTPTRALGRADRELAVLAKALGHPARVAIVRMLLATGDCVCGDIVDRLPLAQATVSQHLKVLKDAGIIRGEIDTPRVCYCIAPEAIQRLSTLIDELS